MLEQFTTSAKSAGCVVQSVHSLSEAVQYVCQLTENCCCSRLPPAVTDAFSGLITVDADHPQNFQVCISYALAGIAETGTLFLELNESQHRAATALPPIHVVLLPASAIVADLQALSPQVNGLLADRPSYLSLTTGPSRTADIERVLTIGVHGPMELHILILEED